MMEILPPWPLFSAFLLASLVLAVTPGPGVFYIVARSLVQGRRHGLASVAGVALGNLGNGFAAAVGLAALFAASSLAFAVVKCGGAFYLVYLGLKMWRTAGGNAGAELVPSATVGGVFRDGLVVALLNPKTTIFFAAFLPQFIDPSVSPIRQAIVLGTCFVAIAMVTDSLYALSAGTVSPWLRGSGTRRLGGRLGGGLLVVLGLFTAVSGSRTTG